MDRKYVKAHKVKQKERARFSFWSMLIAILIPLAVGIISSLFTGDAMDRFATLNKPFLAPPSWVFPVVWTILYILMGLASYFIASKRLYTSEQEDYRAQLIMIYAAQLVFNFFWPLLFFSAQQYFFAFIWLLTMIVLVIILTSRSMNISKTAGILLIPYAIWCVFAAYLNISIALMN